MERAWRRIKGKMDDAEKVRVMDRWRRGEDGGKEKIEVREERRFNEGNESPGKLVVRECVCSCN